MTRTDTERLEWMLARTIRVEHSLHDPAAEFTIRFRALVPKGRGSIRDLIDVVRHAVDAMMDSADGRITLDAAMDTESP